MSGNRIAVITGTSSGIGLISAVELARAGFRVVATMRNLERRSRLEEAAARSGVAANIDVRRLDVCAPTCIAECMDAVVRDYGRLDVLVNNAGFALGGFAEDVTEAELRDQLETNFFGNVAVTKAALPHMRRQRSGHVIMLSSISGIAGQPVTSSYSASKFALEGWAEALRLEMFALGIRVVLVEPGAFDTDIWEKNVKVAKSSFEGASPNRERSQRFVQMVRTRIHKRDPIAVARLIRRIAEDPNPRLRYRVGRDAHLHYWLRQIAPWKVYEKIVRRFAAID